MLDEARAQVSAWLDPVLRFPDGVQSVAQMGLDQLHVEYGAQLWIMQAIWGLVVLLLVGLSRGYVRLLVLIVVGLVLLKLYGYF